MYIFYTVAVLYTYFVVFHTVTTVDIYISFLYD